MDARSPILQRFVDQARTESEVDPREVVTTNLSDPEAIIREWERDRALWVHKLHTSRTAASRYREDRDDAWAELENRFE